MRAVTLTVIFYSFFASISAKAQTTKNNWMFGGSGSYVKSAVDGTFSDGKVSRLEFNPRIGYFFRDNLAAGIIGNFLHNRSSIAGSSPARYTTIGIGPLVRAYLLDKDYRTNLLIEGAFTYNSIKDGPSNVSTQYSEYALRGGPAIFLNNSIGLEILLGYRGFKTHNVDERVRSLTVSLGLQIHLEKQ